MLSGFDNSIDYFLPPVLTVQDIDSVQNLEEDSIRIYINDPLSGDDNFLCNLKNVDVHVMNKNSIVENFEKFERFL